jgi:hypothetical protein
MRSLLQNHLVSKTNVRFAGCLALVFALSLGSPAQTAGYDLFQTGSGSTIDLSSVPGLGTVNLQGVPIQTITGNADTIMHRTQDMPSGGGPVKVNVNALFMQSTAPVTCKNQSADVYVTINNSGGTIPTSVLPQPDALSPSTGTVTIRTDGTYDSKFTVNADVIFVKAGTSVTNSANYLGSMAASSVTLSSTNGSWSASAPSGYPGSGSYPSGGFYPNPPGHNLHKVVPASCGSGTGASRPAGGQPQFNQQKVQCVTVSGTL